MIRITRLADYALVLLARFAARDPGCVLNARELADGAGLPPATTAKVLKALTRAGLLVSHRGTQGGYGLARPAAQVSVADAIAALEGPLALTACANGSERACPLERRCPVRANGRRITDAVRDALAAIPLTELVAAPAAAARRVAGAAARGEAR